MLRQAGSLVPVPGTGVYDGSACMGHAPWPRADCPRGDSNVMPLKWFRANPGRGTQIRRDVTARGSRLPSGRPDVAGGALSTGNDVAAIRAVAARLNL